MSSGPRRGAVATADKGVVSRTYAAHATASVDPTTFATLGRCPTHYNAAPADDAWQY